MASSKDIQKRNDRQMALIIGGVVVAALVIFIGAAILFNVLFTGHVRNPNDWKTVTLTASSYSTTASFDGSVKPAVVSEVRPQASGTVENVAVSEGQVVEKGTVLMTITNKDIVNAAYSNQRAFDSASAARDEAQKVVDQAQADFDRVKAACDAEKKRIDDANAAAKAKDPAAVPQVIDPSFDTALQAAQKNLDTAKSNLSNAQGSYDSARRALRISQEQKSLLTVTAGEAGIVRDIKAHVGDNTADLNSAGASMRIVDPKNLSGFLEVPEAEVDGIARGQEVKVTSDAMPGQEIMGTVSNVGDVMEGETASDGSPMREVRVAFSSTDSITNDMRITGEIRLQDFGTVFYIPTASIENKDGTNYVVVVYDDNTSSEHQVEVIGQTNDGQTVIKGNRISEGAKIRADLSE